MLIAEPATAPDLAPGLASEGAAVSIVAPAIWPADSGDVRRLIHEYVEWLAAAVGVEPAEAQPSLLQELEAIEQWYAPPNGRMILARIDGMATGIAGVHMLERHLAELKRVYLRPGARGRDLGRRMTEAAIREARRLGAKRIVLETQPEVMPAAQRIYRERGFRPIPRYSEMEVEGVIAMELRLGLFASLRSHRP